MHQQYSAQDGQSRLPQTATSGLILTDQEREWIEAANADDSHQWAALNIAPVEFHVWPWRHEVDGTLIVAGKCPLCGRHHGHPFTSPDPWRVPDCSDAIPPFDVRTKPDLVRLRVMLDPMPEELAFALEVDRPDLLTALAGLRRYRRARTGRMLDLRDAERTLRVRRALLSYEIHKTARALITWGIFDEQIGIAVYDGGANLRLAERKAAAQFIRAQGPGPIRLRLERAIRTAYLMLGEGKLT